MFDVGHNPHQLLHRARVYVRNVKAADKAIQRMMDEKRKRGMRLRYSPDYPSQSYFLEARERGALEQGLRCLRINNNVLSVQKHYKPLGA